MSRLIGTILALVFCFIGFTGFTQELGGLARVIPDQSRIEAAQGGLKIELALSQAVPWRVFTLDEPRRLVMDFREVDWRGLDAEALIGTKRVRGARTGRAGPERTRMVLDLDGPFGIESAEMQVSRSDGTARLRLRLRDVGAVAFADAASASALGAADVDTAAPSAPEPRDHAQRDLVVVIDPGHGGIDPGAVHDGTSEKNLMLTFARELREVLLRAGDFEVVLTRNDDSFVSLERRVAVAHRARADLFLSLHADTLREGGARGATVYRLSESASDEASAKLAERHNRADMLAGVDLSGADDVVADVLMDLARLETDPRAERLAEALVLGIRQQDLPLNSRPRRAAGFSVLKSPDIPSVLLELGFLSSERDLTNLRDGAWRDRMARGIRNALQAWRIADAAAAELVRQ